VFLEVRDAAAGILENTTLADLISRGPAAASQARISDEKISTRKTSRKKKSEASVLPMLARGEGND
jgi:hypothetical protein